MKTILLTGIGGLTPRSIAKVIRHNHPAQYYINNIDNHYITLPDTLPVESNVFHLFLFKQKFPAVKTCLVLHGDGSQIPEIYKEKYPRYMDAVEVWGFRSLAFKNQFEAGFGARPKEFLCYSGIPEAFLSHDDKTFEQGVRKFVFVGSLFKLKNVDVTIKALHLAFPAHDFEFHVVGGGQSDYPYFTLPGIVSGVWIHLGEKRGCAHVLS